MAGKFPSLGDFDIPGGIFDLHEWVTDEFIDGELGVTCTLIFPAKRAPCDNCLFSTDTNRSANIYKTGGPIPFANHGICPRCQGRGLLEEPSTESMRLRVYWEASDWSKMGMAIADPEAVCMVIGYMVDLTKFERANFILLNDELKNIRNYKCSRSGEAQPWGFRHNRYFVQWLKRAN
jgi:hypothetical protein